MSRTRPVPLWLILSILMIVVALPTQAAATAHGRGIAAIAFSPNGKILASATRGDTISLWNTATGTMLQTLSDPQGADALAFSPDGTLLASGSSAGTVRLWNAKTSALVRTLMESTGYVTSVAFSPDGRTLAAGGDSIRVWNVATGSLLYRIAVDMSSIETLAFSPHSVTLAAGFDDGTIRVWYAATGSLHRTIDTPSGSVITTVAFSPDGHLLAWGSADKTVQLWNIATGQVIRTLSGFTKGVTSLAFSPEGYVLAAGSRDGTTELWDVGMGQLLRTLYRHTDTVTSLAFSENGYVLASASNDGTIDLWAPAPGTLIRVLASPDAGTTSQQADIVDLGTYSLLKTPVLYRPSTAHYTDTSVLISKDRKTWLELPSVEIDSGSDWSFFPESVAKAIGVDLAACRSSSAMGIGGGLVAIHYAQVYLAIVDMNGPSPDADGEILSTSDAQSGLTPVPYSVFEAMVKSGGIASVAIADNFATATAQGGSLIVTRLPDDKTQYEPLLAAHHVNVSYGPPSTTQGKPLIIHATVAFAAPTGDFSFYLLGRMDVFDRLNLTFQGDTAILSAASP